jgi:hypothetical protein
MSARDNSLAFLEENLQVLKEGLRAVENSALSKKEKAIHRQRIELAMLIPQFMILRNYDEYGLTDKDAFFEEFVENMRDCGLLTEAIKNEFREGWALRELVKDKELVHYYKSRRYKLDCVDLLVNQKMSYERVSKRVLVDIPTLEKWVEEFSAVVKK